MARERHGRDARRPAFDDGDDNGGDGSGGDRAADLTTDVIDEIAWYMREHKVSRADLAGAMGVSTGRVSRILSGGESLTPRTLGTVVAALGARIEITLCPANRPAPA